MPNAPSAHFCVNCGAILKAAASPAPRGPSTVAPPAARSGVPDLPPLPVGLAGAGPSSIAPAAVPAQGSGAHKADAAVARGERMVAWIALGVLVVAAVFFLQRIVSMSFDRNALDATPATTTSSAAALLAAPEPAVPGPPAPAGSFDPAPPVVVAEVPPQKTSPREPLLVEEGSEAASARSLTPSRPAVRPATPPPSPAAEPETALRPVAPPPQVAAVEPPLVTAGVPADSRWDRMRGEIGACPGNFFERVACEHGIRASYCEGWYGRVEECPSGRTADYGN